MRRTTWGAMLLAITLLLPTMAYAGRATINDKADILTNADEQGIEGYAAQVSFDVHVITQKGTGDRALDDATLQRSMNGSIRSNAVVVGISLGPNIVNVKYGVGTNIPSNSGQNIQTAGVDMLRARQWGEAVGAMLRRARGLQIAQAQQYRPAPPPLVGFGEARPPAPLPPPAVAYDPPMKPVETSEGHPFLWLLLCMIGIPSLVWFFFIRRKDDSASLSPSWQPSPPPIGGPSLSGGYTSPRRTYASRSSSPSYAASPRYVAPPAPVIIHDHSGGNELTSLAAGVALGSSLSHREPERVVERVIERPSYEAPRYEPPSPSTSFDPPASSSSTSFDDDSSSSTGSTSWDSDSGPSSSSSFDSGSSSSSTDF